MRAIAGVPDLEVRLRRRPAAPLRPQGAPAGAAAQADGARRGDHPWQSAIRLRCGLPANDPLGPPRPPTEGKNARAVFDAVEQARVEAVGARRMGGVARNLAAMLEDRYHRGNYQEVSDRADAPLEDAVALMVRERLTGDAPPASSRKVVELWRDWVEERAGGELARLTDSIEDQSRFAGNVRDLLVSLEMADELGSEGGEEEDESDDSGDGEDDQGAAESGESADAASPEDVEASADDSEAGRGRDQRDGRRRVDG